MMSTPPDYSLVPFGPDYATVVLPLVPELRQRVAATLPPGTKLWGGDLLNPDDAAGTHLLAKCVAAEPRCFAELPAELPRLGAHPPGPAGRLTPPSSRRARFLRARDLNLDKAQAMLENTLEWRKTYGTDAIATDTSIPDCLATVAVLSVRAGVARARVRTSRGRRERRLAGRAASARRSRLPPQGHARSGHQIIWFEYGTLSTQPAWGAHPARPLPCPSTDIPRRRSLPPRQGG